MCLAIYKPADKSLDWDDLQEGFRCNSDGAGFAVVSDGRLIIEKGLFTFDAFREAFAPYMNHQAVVHFRLATHGTKDSDNCHPFVIGSDNSLVLIHNGILPIACDVDKKKSDTWHYVYHILNPLYEDDADFFNQPHISFMGEAAIGGNKFVFLRADGEYGIWNEDDGHWKDGVWYSNGSYKRSIITGFSGCRTVSLSEREGRWWRDEVASACSFDADVIHASHDPENSTVYDDLTDQDQLVYDLLLQDGWEVDMLDDLVESHGANALYDLAKDTRFEKETF